ncbi:MAG: T9SS C-terminal target domain-containing protein [Bacteroidetes bacterium]|nr:MAG: T9SS C-terminal target domain-containing protein [Bacteroidota bacterium]
MHKLYLSLLALLMGWPGFGILVAQPPANDDVCNAIALLVDGTVNNFDNFGSTVQPGEDGTINPPAGNGAGNYAWYETGITNSVWFTFVAPPSGALSIDLCNGGVGTDFDTQVAVYEVGNCNDFNTFTFLGANDDITGDCPGPGDPYASILDITCLTPGNTYYILVDGWVSLPTSADSVGNFGISLNPVPGSALAIDFAQLDPICDGAGGGAAAALVTGGGFPYTYSWSNGSSDSAISDVGPGTYIVTVTDFCDSVLVDSVTLLPSAGTDPLAARAGDDILLCQGSSVELSGMAEGGSARRGRTGFIVSGTAGLGHFKLREPVSTITGIGPVSAPAIYGADFAFGVLFGISDAADQLVAIDTASGSVTVVGPAGKTAGHTWTGLAFDETTGTMYGVSTDVTTSQLYTIDIATGAATPTVTVDLVLPIWLAIDNNGLFYSMDIATDRLYTLDPSTGLATEIGPVGFNANFAQDADFDPETNELYLMSYGTGFSNSVVRLADVTTGYCFALGEVPGGGNVGAFAISGNNVEAYSYTWSPALALSNPFVPNPVASPPVTATYFLTVVDECGAIAMDTLVVNVNEPGTLSLTAVPFNDSTGSVGSATASLSGGSAPFSYLWSNGDTSATTEVSEPGMYVVTVTDAAGCEVTDSIMVDDITAIDPLVAAGIGRMEVFPNPAGDFVKVRLDMVQPVAAQLMLFDAQGRAIEARTLPTSQTATETFDLKRLPAGVYLLKVATPQGHVLTRISHR